MFTTESAIRYAICVNSGVKPNWNIIGTKIGAMIAHFADADPRNKSKNAPKIMNAKINGIPVKPIDSKKFAPLTERIVPRFV